MDAVLYARVSSDPLGDLSSVTRQLVDQQDLAELRGDTAHAKFVDDNERAYRRRTPRPQFTAMRAHIEAGVPGVVRVAPRLALPVAAGP